MVRLAAKRLVIRVGIRGSDNVYMAGSAEVDRDLSMERRWERRAADTGTLNLED
jgi:hypothetical protein